MYVTETHYYKTIKDVDTRFRGNVYQDLQLKSFDDKVRFYRFLAKQGDATYKDEVFKRSKEILIKFSFLSRYKRRRNFFKGFNEVGSGALAGLLVRDEEIYLTAMPGLYKLDKRSKKLALIQDGFGVHIGWGGHEFHGLVQGPDGRIYFSMADKGFSLTTKEGVKHHYPDMGAVLRCEPDGSKLEVFAFGLRNPQELVFDHYGRLFTVDNDSDRGDKPRFIYIAEGADSGWRFPLQSLKDRGVWMKERIWEKQLIPNTNFVQPKWILPASDYVSNGPSGLAYYPGLSFDSKYKNHFFLSNFPKNVLTWKYYDKGAGFGAENVEVFIDGIGSSDCAFAPDGKFYVIDWGRKFKINRASIFSIETEESSQKKQKDVQKILNKNFSLEKREKVFKSYLANEDYRVRLKTQLFLSKQERSDIFFEVVQENENQFAVIHSLWGLGQIARKGSIDKEQMKNLLEKLLSYEDKKIVEQSIKLIGDLGYKSLGDKLIDKLYDNNAKIQYFSALNLGKIKEKSAIKSLIMNVKNLKDDPYLWHSYIYTLAKIDVPLKDYYSSLDKQARLAIVLALRKRKSLDLEYFLKENEPQIFLEAVRAIYDLNIKQLLDKLADLVNSKEQLELARAIGSHAVFENTLCELNNRWGKRSEKSIKFYFR